MRSDIEIPYAVDANEISAKSINNKVFFAGDATSKKYMTTAHCAYISGVDAANKIMG